jgi:hypothetical protein
LLREKKNILSKQKSEGKISTFPALNNNCLKDTNKGSSRCTFENRFFQSFIVPKQISKSHEINNDKFKKEEKRIEIAGILKRFKDKNLKEADAKNRTMYNTSFLMINKNQSIFNKFILHSFSKKNHLINNDNLELVLNDKLKWSKHEEVWNIISSLTNKDYTISDDIEQFLLPPNDTDILLSIYFTTYNTDCEKIILGPNNILRPRQEIIKWKDAFRKSILRWHPDKLEILLEKVKINENINKILKKKSGTYINNINRSIGTIVEHLRVISKNIEKCI